MHTSDNGVEIAMTKYGGTRHFDVTPSKPSKGFTKVSLLATEVVPRGDDAGVPLLLWGRLG